MDLEDQGMCACVCTWWCMYFLGAASQAAGRANVEWLVVVGVVRENQELEAELRQQINKTTMRCGAVRYGTVRYGAGVVRCGAGAGVVVVAVAVRCRIAVAM